MTEKDQAPAALTDIALTVLKKRYLIKDDQGRVAETPETMFRRVADTIAQVDARYGATGEQVFRVEIKGWCSEFETRDAAGRQAGAPAAG